MRHLEPYPNLFNPIRSRSRLIVLAALIFAGTTVHAQTRPADRKNTATQTTSTSTPVSGSGTNGQLAKWAGFSTSSSVLVDSIITESKAGNIGIGTTTPGSRMTVQGTIESLLGGFKFPDGSIQTTSGISSVAHDPTLTGNGTNGSPLGVSIPLRLFGKVDPPYGVLDITNLTDHGTGIEVDGGNGGNGIRASGGSDNNGGEGGTGVQASGGDSSGQEVGGNGVRAFGGRSPDAVGGTAVLAVGGDGRLGGRGIEASGGSADSGAAGVGLAAAGGNSSTGNGGTGITAMGGTGSQGGDGIFAQAGHTTNGTTSGRAAAFLGIVEIGGILSVSGTKNFKIDHPLDPENKYLLHAAIESSEVLNIYSGNVVTDDKGEASVTLPDWFEAINKDLRYQLTAVGTFARAIVAEKVKDNRFTIRTDAPRVEVSWQVTGVRSDAAMLKHPFKSEEDKADNERGFYVTPEAFGQPKEKQIERARHPELTGAAQQRRAPGSTK